MFTFGLNEEEFINYQDKINNINFHILDLCKEKNHVNNEQNQNKDFAIKDIFSKENNACNSSMTSPESKKFISDSIYFNLAKAGENSKIFLNKKRNHEKTYSNNKENILELKENLKEKNIMKINNEIKKGRRKKDVDYDIKVVHDKFKGDNIIKKIKNNIFDYILERLNKSLKNDNYEFYPLTKELNTNLNKDFNEKLLDRTIYDIYVNSDLSKKFANIPDSNKILIKKIYDENIEIATQSILEKKFKDILNDIRKKDLDYFLDKIKDKETKNNKPLNDSYMNAVKKMLFKYEFWFKVKLERSKRKK